MDRCRVSGQGPVGKGEISGMSSQKFYKLPVEIAARKDLTPASKIVLAVLADRIGDNGFCWPGVRTLAKDVGLSVTGVLGCLSFLEDKGIIEVERRGNGRSNRYRLTIDSAQQSCALKKPERSGKLNSGAQQSGAQALSTVGHNQTDQLNQTKDIRPNSESFRLAELLLSKIFARKPDFKKPNLEAWSDYIERMIRLDERKPERIEAVICWSQKDPFWQNNILSTAKLREKFDQLELKMGSKKNDPTQRNFGEQDSRIGRTVCV
jgi:DNA-binding MarR family transcriptional regulator